MAEDAARGAYFPQATEAWRDPGIAAARDAWTAQHVDRYLDRTRDGLLRGLDHHGSRLVTSLRRGDGPVVNSPPWMVVAPVADLAVHLADLREARGMPPDTSGAAARLGVAAYRDWLHERLVRRKLPALRLSDGQREWQAGEGNAVGGVTASAFELFRMISGRRSPAQIGRYDWTIDPTPYLPVIAPYPLPD